MKGTKYFRILLVFVAITTPYLLSRIEAIQNDTGDPLQLNRFRRFNGRFRRNSDDDNLKSSVSNLQMIARITNAIYLQQGLISGTIPSDALISELLHFGTIKPSDISTLDIAKIQTAVNTLKELPKKLKPDNKIKVVEDWLKAVGGIVADMKGLGNIDSWSSENLKKDIGTLKTNGVTPTVVKTLMEAPQDWEVNHKKVSGDPKKMNDLIAPLNTIKSALKDLSEMKPLYTFTGAPNAIDMIRTLTLAQIGVDQYVTNGLKAILDKGREKPYFDYVDLISTQIGSINEAKASLEIFRRLAESRRIPMNLEFTAGFPDGSSDLMKVYNDLKDVWIRKVINSTKFPMALDKLKELDAPLKIAQDVFNSKDVMDHGSSILFLADSLNLLLSKLDKLKSGITNGQGCKQTGSRGSIEYSKIYELKGHLETIDYLLGNMTLKTGEVIDYLQKNQEIQQWCDDVINICQKADKPQFENYANMKQFTLHVKNIGELTKNVVDVQVPDGSVAKGTTIQKQAEEAEKFLADVDTYHKDVKFYSEYFTCLQKDDIFEALDTVESIEKARTDDPSRSTSLDTEIEAIKKVAGTKEALKKLETTMSAQKAFKSTETDALELLIYGSRHSQNIGLAVQGISNMKEALEKRTDLEGLLKIKDVILKYQKTMKDPEDATNLNSLLALLDQIQKMFTSLDTFKKSVKPSTSTTLADYSEIFQNAKSVSGASEDVKKIAETIGKLKESVTDPGEKKSLEDVESTLKDMDSMGLDFARFQKSFDGSKDALSALDAFFSSFGIRIAQVSTANVAAAAAAAEAKKQKEKEQTNRILIVVGILLLIVVFGGTPLLMYHYKRYVFNRIFCFWRKKRSNDYYQQIYLKHFGKAIGNFTEANKKNWTVEQYSEGERFKAVGLYFENHFENDNGQFLFQEAKCIRNADESLHSEPLPKKSRVKLRGYGKRFRNDFYHASRLKLLNGRTLILAQTPIFGFRQYDCAVEKGGWYRWMVSQEKSRRIFMLNPLKYGDRIRYSAYFPQKLGETIKFGDITITCKKCKKIDKNEITAIYKEMQVRQLSVKIGKAKEFMVVHHWLPCWETGTLQEPFLIADLVEEILYSKDKNPPIIHCGDGVSETGIIAFLAYCVTMLTVKNKVDLPECLKRVREACVECILNKWTYGFSAYVLMIFFLPGVNLDNLPASLYSVGELIYDGWHHMIGANESKTDGKESSMKTGKEKKSKKSTMTAVPQKDVKETKPMTLENPDEILDKMQNDKRNLKPEQKSWKTTEQSEKEYPGATAFERKMAKDKSVRRRLSRLKEAEKPKKSDFVNMDDLYPESDWGDWLNEEAKTKEVEAKEVEEGKGLAEDKMKQEEKKREVAITLELDKTANTFEEGMM